MPTLIKNANTTLLTGRIFSLSALIKKVSNHKTQIIKATAAVFMVLSASYGQALEKAPDIWSFKSKLVTKSLLVDITRYGDRIFAAGSRGHIIYSIDDGNTWTQSKVPTTQMLTGIDFPTAKQGWAVGHDGNIFYSEDAGENWILQYDGLAHRAEENLGAIRVVQGLLKKKNIEVKSMEQQIADEKDEAVKVALESKLHDLKYELEDAEIDVEDAESQLANTVEPPFLDVWFKDTTTGFAIGAFGKAMRTDNSGKTWENMAGVIDNLDEVHYNSIEGSSNGTLFISGEMGTLFRSLDFGKTWENLNSPYDGSFFGIAFDEESKTVLTYGITGAIFRSEDWGESWKSLEFKVANSLNGAVFTRDGGVTVVGVGGYVLSSSDKGINMQLDVLPGRQHMNKIIETKTGRLIAVGEGGVHIIPEKKAVASISKGM